MGGINANIPLAERMRPKTISEFFGQEKIFGEGSFRKRNIGIYTPHSIPELDTLILYTLPSPCSNFSPSNSDHD
jgi:replication-associated recombination protein RarA